MKLKSFLILLLALCGLLPRPRKTYDEEGCKEKEEGDDKGRSIKDVG